MPIGKALLLKGLGGLAALGGTIGGGCYLYDHFSNQDTKFDRGLIEFLEADDSTNIQFSVKKVDGSNSESDISNDFPTFTTSTDTKTATVTIKVSINSASTGGTNEGTLTEKSGATDGALGTKKYLQKLNGDGTNDGTAWTWECKIVFEKTEAATVTELKEEEKKKIVNNNTPKGFFDKLKDTDATNKHKELKIKFIKDCAAARGKAENRKINKKESLDSNKIESTKTFKLIDNSETTPKLIPEDQSDFNYWFKNEGN